VRHICNCFAFEATEGHYIGPRTQKQKLQSLLAADDDSSTHVKDSAAFINVALRLETDRYAVKYIFNACRPTLLHREQLVRLVKTKDGGPSDATSVSRARAKFSRDLNAWRKVQLQRYPKLRDHIPLVDSATPEEAQLQLPSAFTTELRQSLGLTQLAIIEYQLREGQAHDALQALRQVIQEFNYNLLDKKNNVHGIAATLRSESFLRVLTSDKQIAARTYRRSRNAMLSLGLSETDSHWRELRDDELWGKNVSVVRSMGDSKRRDPWFWHVVAPRGLSKEKEEEWSLDSES
jgi:hypothetical protein